MSGERASQIPFGDLGVELVTNLDTGRQTLRPRRVRKSVEQIKTPPPTRQWWEITGLMAFHNAGEGWKQGQAALFADEFGYNVESAGAQMRKAETEETLRRAFGTAKRSGITSLDITKMIKAESLVLEEKLGKGANWVPGFVDSSIALLGEVYGLKPTTREALKGLAHQRRLPQFT